LENEPLITFLKSSSCLPLQPIYFWFIILLILQITTIIF